MGSITTAMNSTFKRDLMQAKHCLNANAAPTGDATNSNFNLTNLSSLAGLVVGMFLAGTGIPANTILARFLSSTSIEMSKAATASNSGITVTASADTFKMALIKPSPTGTYGAATTNYTDLTGNSDEITGTGYSAGGTAMTNVSPTLSGTTAYTTFSPNPSWTSASFSTAGAQIYNTTQRGETATISVSTHSFGGTQTVTSGTFTAVMPTADASNAILRIA